MTVYSEVIRFVENGAERRILHKEGTNQLWQEQKGRLTRYMNIDCCVRPFVNPDTMKTPEAKKIFDWCQAWLAGNNVQSVNA